MDFEAFPSIPRLSRNCVITEKLDGTNASIYIGEDGTFLCGSRRRWITPEDDNYGFAKWCHANKDELLKLGPGHHFGEWWGKGIQRAYDLNEKRFSLFNAGRWTKETTPPLCHVTPILAEGMFSYDIVHDSLNILKVDGSKAAPGFMKPEGIVIYHEAGRCLFKKTLEDDESPKSLVIVNLLRVW